MDINYIELGSAIGAMVLTIGLGFLSQKYRGKLNQIKDLITYAVQAMDDDKIDKAELQEIIRRIKMILG